MSQSHVPAGYTSVTPYLIVKEVEVLLDFLRDAFDAQEVLRIPGPDGLAQHAEVRIGDAMVMMGRKPEGEPDFRASLYLYVDDCDTSYARALAAGATAHHEPADQFYGDRSGSVHGPCGTHFGIATHVETLTPEQLKERMPGSGA